LNTGQLQVAGSQNGGQTGTGNTGTTPLLSWTNVMTLPIDTKLYSDVIYYMAPTRTSGLIQTPTNQLYRTGDNSSGQIGNNSTSTVYSFTISPLPVDVTTIEQICLNARSTFILSNNNIYGTGQLYTGLGAASSTTIIKLSKPI
jgi:alpha-tubulin suppressor-like RCC1 family protein